MTFGNFTYNLSSIQSMALVDHAEMSDDQTITGTQIKVYFAPDQANLQITPQRTKSGVVYQYSIQANLPRIQSALKLAAETAFKRYVILITDSNGTIYLFGKKNKGYKLKHSGEINDILNTMSITLQTLSSLPIDIFENLNEAINSDFVITNTIIQACSSTEVLQENKAVVNLADGAIVTHNVLSDSVAVSFFENGIHRKDLLGIPIAIGQFRAYLPSPDDEPYTFTGDILIEKRNPIL